MSGRERMHTESEEEKEMSRVWAMFFAAFISAAILFCFGFELDAAAEEEVVEEIALAPMVVAEDTREDAQFDSNALSWDYGYVVRVVGSEARGEPFEGIVAVAQCIADTAERTGMNPEEVVRQPNQYAPPMPDYIFDNCETVNEACLLVFACGERVVDDDIEFFKTLSCKSAWHDSLRYVCTIGNHQFYALEGGTK